jgi:hypothetical protein
MGKAQIKLARGGKSEGVGGVSETREMGGAVMIQILVPWDFYELSKIYIPSPTQDASLP